MYITYIHISLSLSPSLSLYIYIYICGELLHGIGPHRETPPPAIISNTFKLDALDVNTDQIHATPSLFTAICIY